MDVSLLLKWAGVVPRLIPVILQGITAAEGQPGMGGNERLHAVLEAVKASIDIVLPGNKTAGDVTQILGLATDMIGTVVALYNKTGAFSPSPTATTENTVVPSQPVDNTADIARLKAEIARLREDLKATNGDLDAIAKINKKIATKTDRIKAMGGTV